MVEDDARIMVFHIWHDELQTRLFSLNGYLHFESRSANQCGEQNMHLIIILLQQMLVTVSEQSDDKVMIIREQESKGKQCMFI